MSLVKEFREFAVKGKMVDLAIGVIIGAAFNKIVDSLVKDVLTPPLGFLTGGVNFTNLAWTLRGAVTNERGEVIREALVLKYGMFLQNCIDFLIVAITIFLVIKAINSLRNKAEDETNKEVPTPKDIQLLAEIRDQMKETTELLKQH